MAQMKSVNDAGPSNPSASAIEVEIEASSVRKTSWLASWWRKERLLQAEHDYAVAVTSCADEDFSDLDAMGFLQTTGLKDRMGRPVILLSNSSYSLVWAHTESSYIKNCPSVAWMWHMYENLPERFRANLQHVYVLHCDLTLWVSTMTVCPWFSSLLWRKIRWVSRIEFLWEYISKTNFKLPDFVVEHDNILEDQPLHDYGLVANKEALRGMGPPGHM
eukprot:gene1473-32858_t